MRAGMPYYAAAGSQLRNRGYAMSSVFNWRLPTLAWLFAVLPSDTVARGLLGGVALLSLLLWYTALRRQMGPPVAFAVCLALLGVLACPFMAGFFRIHEAWAGVAIALSIAASVLELPTVSVLAGLAALAVRELSLAYVALAVLLAWRKNRRRQVLAWLAGVTVFCAGWALHAHQVLQHQRAGDQAQLMSWLQFGGWHFVLKTALLNAWTLAAPEPVTAVVWPLALLGLLAWRTPLGQRTAATAYVYVVTFLFVGLPYNHLWGLMYAGLVLPGLLFVPAALRDLWQRAWAADVHPS
jgi:hypothetical protein